MGSFIVEKVAKMRGGRLGNFRFLATDEEISYPTPMFLIHTLSGSVPHVTREVFDIIYPPASSQPPPPIQISLDSTYTFWDVVKPSGKDISTFVGLSKCPSFLTVHDPLQEHVSGFNDNQGISVWARQGRVTISNEKFVNVVSGFNPSLFQVISDYDVGAHSSKKRFLKSTTRSLKSLEECTSQTSPFKSGKLFATLEAAWFTLNEEETNRALGTILEKSNYISGFVVGGLGSALVINPSKKISKNEKSDKSATEKIVLEKINIEETLPKLLSKLPENKARYVPGPFNPVEIIDMVSMGVDIFDSSIITKMADDGLVFNFDLKQFLPDKEKVSTDISEGLAGSDISASSSQVVLNLKDKRYFDDFSPISHDCDCYTCRRHTKSYINHLFTVKELLGPVLMMAHNLTSFGRFFEAIRFCIQQDSENDKKQYLNNLKDSVRTSVLINTTKNDDNSKSLTDLQPEGVPAITVCT